MKIIFDSEEQKEKLLNAFADCFGECPVYFGFINHMVGRDKHCKPADHNDCYRCWEQCGIEYEVKGDATND